MVRYILIALAILLVSVGNISAQQTDNTCYQTGDCKTEADWQRGWEEARRYRITDPSWWDSDLSNDPNVCHESGDCETPEDWEAGWKEAWRLALCQGKPEEFHCGKVTRATYETERTQSITTKKTVVISVSRPLTVEEKTILEETRETSRKRVLEGKTPFPSLNYCTEDGCETRPFVGFADGKLIDCRPESSAYSGDDVCG